FSIGDVETPVDSLMVSGHSSNPDLVPDANILFGGSGSNRTVTLRPATNRSEERRVGKAVEDGDGGAASASFLLSVNSVNDPPANSSLAHQSTDDQTPAAPISFSIGDVETPVDSLMVSGHSSNPDLVPDANILFGGSGSNRTVTLRPATNQFGSTTITLTVRDGDGGAASASFLLSVNSVNDPPTISSIANQSTNEDTPTAAIPFSIGDVETPPDNLMVSGRSSNPDLVPDANILFGGSGSNRTVTLRPATNQFGSTTDRKSVV